MIESKKHEQPGATGKFPQGKLNEKDEGELAVALTVQNNRLVLNFGKNLSWIAMTKEQAEGFGQILLERAKQLQ